VTGKSIQEVELLLNLLAGPRGANVSDLVLALKLSPRTILRHIEALRASGHEILEVPDPTGKTNAKRWLTKRATGTGSPTQLGSTPHLLLEMRLAVSRVGRFETKRTKLLTETAKLTIASGFSDQLVGPFSYGEKFFYSTRKGYKNYAGMEAILDDIVYCVTRSVAAMVTYRSPKSEVDKHYEVEPLTIVEHQNGLYLVTAIPKHDRNIATLAVERIKSFQMLRRKHFQRPTAYSPADHLSNSFGITNDEPRLYRIHFDQSVAVYGTERIWSENQQAVFNPDGSASLSFKVGGQDEILRWILGFGAHATVIEPVDVAEAIRREAEAMLRVGSGIKEISNAGTIHGQ